jgi:hypothetical protein
LHRDAVGLLGVDRHVRESVRPNGPVRAGLASLIAYGAGAPADLARVFGEARDEDLLPLAAALATPWLVTAGDKVAGFPEVRLLPLPGARPRVRIAGAIVEEGTVRRARWILMRGQRPPDVAVVDAVDALQGGEPIPTAQARALALSLPRVGQGEAAVTRYRPEEVIVRTSARGPALLVLLDAFYPGWRAAVDGTEVAIHRADVLGRAVRVPAGEHTVRFRFESPALRLGTRLSFATVAALALVAMVQALGRRRRRGATGGGR